MQEIILKSDGTAVLRNVTETPCTIVADLADQLSATAVRTVKGIFATEAGRVGLVASKDEVYLGSTLPSLTLSMNWETRNGLLLPCPAPKGAVPSGAHMKMEWTPFSGMTLMFIAKIEPYHIEQRKCFLLALDSGTRNFQLPLPNIFDDCSICMGDFNSDGSTYLECFQKALAHFQSSPWNADLMDAEKQTKLETLIQFKITKGEKHDTFERSGSGSLWWNQCWSRETRVTDAARRLL